MNKYTVYIFLTNCFITAPIQVSSNVSIEPFEGIGVLDVANLIDQYLDRVLEQVAQPAEQKLTTSRKIGQEGASIIIKVANLDANSHNEAIKMTEETVMICRDILALCQLQRGSISAFLSIQTDTSPPQLYVYLRPPYPIIRRIQNTPIGESESDIFSKLFMRAKHPLFRVYLSLYAGTVAYSDTLISEIDLEIRLVKTWSLLETMALSEKGFKDQKVKALFLRYQLSTACPNYLNHIGEDLLDIAYEWRNIIAHSGGCGAATKSKDVKFCQTARLQFEEILEELSQSCRMLLHAYANSLI